MLTFKQGGVHPSERKDASARQAIASPALPAEVSIHMNQHLGRPAKVAVKVKDEVKVGDIVGQSEGLISANVHSPVSGIVKRVEKRHSAAGYPEMCVSIEVDLARTMEDERRFAPDPDLVLESLAPAQLLERVKAAGIVGMGGAAFPTSVKLSPPSDKKIDTLLINGAECEPYLTADHQLMLERADEILKGIEVLQRILGVEQVVIGIEENKPDAIGLLYEKVQARQLKHYRVEALRTRYPQGGEKQLIWAALKREVPSGKLPFEVGVVVQNVATALAAYEAIYWNKPLFERVVTVTGYVKKPGNYRLPLGVSFQDAIQSAGGFVNEAKVRSVIHGGPMMGKSVRDLDVTIMKGTSGIVVLSEDDIAFEPEGPCIRCGRCVSVCPMGLMPTELAQAARLEQAEHLEDAPDCMECGCCSYTCPTRRALVHWIRIGKAVLRQAQKNKAQKSQIPSSQAQRSNA